MQLLSLVLLFITITGFQRLSASGTQGFLSGKSYTNEQLMFTYQFPADWVVEQVDSQSSELVSLLNAQTGPLQSPTATMTLSAEKIAVQTGSLDLSEYVDAIEQSRPLKGWVRVGEQTTAETPGRTWLQANFRTNDNTSMRELAVLVCASHGYVLRLFYFGTSEDWLHNAIKTSRGIRFIPDWSESSANDVGSEANSVSRRVRISSGVLYSNQTKWLEPNYPDSARRDRVRGGVIVSLVVGTDGAVKRIYVLEGNPALTQSAIEAMRDWRYKPYVLNGRPVEVDSVAWVEFK